MVQGDISHHIRMTNGSLDITMSFSYFEKKMIMKYDEHSFEHKIRIFYLQAAQVIFIIFNSFQGLIIFVLYCVRKPSVRQQWASCCRLRREDDGTIVLITMGKTLSTGLRVTNSHDSLDSRSAVTR